MKHILYRDLKQMDKVRRRQERKLIKLIIAKELPTDQNRLISPNYLVFL